MLPWIRDDVFRDTRFFIFLTDRFIFRHFLAKMTPGKCFGPSKAPLEILSGVKSFHGEPFGPSKAPLGCLSGPRRPPGEIGTRSGRRRGDGKGPILVACSPQGKGAEAT